MPRLQRGQKLVVATHNAGKLREFKSLLAPFDLILVSAGELGLAEPEETGTTYRENAGIKAHAACAASGLWSLSDDSGLAVDQLDGAPGVHSARWAGPERNFDRAMARVRDELMQTGSKISEPFRGAFIAVLCLVTPGGEMRFFEGRVAGTLVWPPRGSKGFGYDPMFQPDGHNRTFGEMEESEKHYWAKTGIGLSHRSRAFSLFVEECCPGE